ncbi:unnamed protein product [Meloidogyne enterolobii]|uniref:Uncharacterized protein n=1 Tax=Meloidogyne enterolobii TaxID=390850 RepID=A0ACB0YHK0_MELEN
MHAETINNKIDSEGWPARAREEDVSNGLNSHNEWENQVNF